MTYQAKIVINAPRCNYGRVFFIGGGRICPALRARDYKDPNIVITLYAKNNDFKPTQIPGRDKD